LLNRDRYANKLGAILQMPSEYARNYGLGVGSKSACSIFVRGCAHRNTSLSTWNTDATSEANIRSGYEEITQV
jgi:hypothetical protein